MAGYVAEGDRVGMPLGGLPQLILCVDDESAMLGAFILGSIFEAAQEYDLPAAQDNPRECHPTSFGLPGRSL
ncbi:MAG TPA: hypothetical protein VFD26_06905 [Methyloceanibacter sp.]|nr:hypothetical protein [Methyloceanibacter sp.]